MKRENKNPKKKIDLTYDSVISLLHELYSEISLERKLTKEAYNTVNGLIKGGEDVVLYGKNQAELLKSIHATNESSLDIINTIANVLKYKDKKEEEDGKLVKNATLELDDAQKKKIQEMHKKMLDIKSTVKKINNL